MANIHVRSMDERHVPNIGWFNQGSDQPILNLDALKLIKSDSSRKAQGTMAVNTGPRAPGPFVPNLGIIQFCLAPAGSWDPTTSPKVGFKIFKGRPAFRQLGVDHHFFCGRRKPGFWPLLLTTPWVWSMD